MTTFSQQLLSDFDRDLDNAAAAATDEFVRLTRRDPATPKDTGRLGDGIRPDPPQRRPGSISVDVRSTATSETGADYGTILDRSTGRRVDAADYGHQAFGPFSKPVGGRRFVRSFKVTTEHVGWWEQATRNDHMRAASEQFARFDL